MVSFQRFTKHLQLCIFPPLLMYESSQLHLEPDWPLTLSSHLFQHVPSMAKLWRELMINLPSNISFCWQFSSTFISTTVRFQGNVEIDETRWNNYTQSAWIYHIWFWISYISQYFLVKMFIIFLYSREIDFRTILFYSTHERKLLNESMLKSSELLQNNYFFP